MNIKNSNYSSQCEHIQTCPLERKDGHVRYNLSIETAYWYDEENGAWQAIGQFQSIALYNGVNYEYY